MFIYIIYNNRFYICILATFQGLLAPTRKTGAGGKFDIIYDVMSRVATFSINIENLRQRGIGKLN